MRFVFTGPAEVDGMRVPRRLLIQMAREAGHEVGTSVSASTDYVVSSSVDFMGRKGKKLQTADRLGIPCINPDTFAKFCNEGR